MWEDVVAKFLNQYLPQSKANKGKQEISSFQQDGDEILTQDGDMFKELLKKISLMILMNLECLSYI